MADWSRTLDGLPGLSAAQKGKARFILMAKFKEHASLLVSGHPDVAAEAIKEMLDAEAGLGVGRTTGAEGAGAGGAGGAGAGGLGSPSATAEDGAVPGPVPGSTTAAGAAAQALAVPTSSLRRLARLLNGEETVGSACLVAAQGRTLHVVTARHCLLPTPGQPIGDLGLTAFGHMLRHVASFPDYDVSLLRIELSDGGGADLEGITPFTLATGLGLSLNTRVVMLGFMEAADKDVPGVQKSTVPLQSSGVISWLSPELNEAVADYPGALPNCSGGAVVLQDGWELAGVHLGTLYHEAGQRPGGDVQPAVGDQQGGATGGSGSEPMETTTWACEPGEAASATGAVKKRRRGGGRVSPSLEAQIQFCVVNVPHKACLGRFVPAHTLHRLLRLALGTTGADSQGGASH